VNIFGRIHAHVYDIAFNDPPHWDTVEVCEV